MIEVNNDTITDSDLLRVSNLFGVAGTLVIPNPNIDITGRDCNDGLACLECNAVIITGAGDPIAAPLPRGVKKVAIDEENAPKFDQTEEYEE
jgi:hypothetical protein